MALPLLPLAELAVSAGGAPYVVAGELTMLAGAAEPRVAGRPGGKGVWVELLEVAKTHAVLLVDGDFFTWKQVFVSAKLVERS